MLLGAVHFAQLKASFSSSPSGSVRMSMVSTALFTSVNYLLYHRKSPARQRSDSTTALNFSLDVKRGKKLVAKKKRKVSYRRFGFVSPALSV